MSCIKPYKLGYAKDMEYVSWFVTSQTDNHATVTIRGLNKDEVMDNRPRRVCIGRGAASKPVGKELTVEIEVFTSGGWVPKYIERIDNITNDRGEIIAMTFMSAMEDYNDNDYNDITIHIAAWKEEGK